MIVGCGGNGSAVAAGLPYLHQALLAYGHPGGLHVKLVDGDRISATNCVRQPFSRSEIGLHKSIVLANRLNLFWGLGWEGIPEHCSSQLRFEDVQIVIGCVDSAAARFIISECTAGCSRVHYWLDLGNKSDGGQFVLGEPLNSRNHRSAPNRPLRSAASESRRSIVYRTRRSAYSLAAQRSDCLGSLQLTSAPMMKFLFLPYLLL
jgi:PRTRC genetic system ThiF family protein